jgi:hypothetical protein
MELNRTVRAPKLAPRCSSSTEKVAYKPVCAVRPNPSLEPTRYGMHCLPAPGPVGYSPSAGKQRTPSRAGSARTLGVTTDRQCALYHEAV